MLKFTGAYLLTYDFKTTAKIEFIYINIYVYYQRRYIFIRQETLLKVTKNFILNHNDYIIHHDTKANVFYIKFTIL